MSFCNLLNQFLGSSEINSGHNDAGGLSNTIGNLTSNLPGGLLGGGAAGSVMALLMGNRSARKFAGKVAGYGGAAMLGGLAFSAYKNWQKNNQGTQAQYAHHEPSPGYDYGANHQHALTPKFELKLIKTMIASAKADGHIDADEQQKIFQAVEQMALSNDTKATIFDLLNQSIPVDDIVRGVHDMGHKSELYLAACLVINPDHPSEELFLNQLSKGLALPEDLRQHIELQAEQAIKEIN